MSDWNKYHGNNYDYGYQTAGGESWMLLASIVLLVGVPVGAIWVYRLADNYLKTHTVADLIGVVVLAVMAVTFLAIIINGTIRLIENWWDGLCLKWGWDRDTASYVQGSQITNNTTTIQQKGSGRVNYYKGAKTTGLLVGEREKAPRAQFFGRIGNKTYDRVGMYEEGWLNTYEHKHWVEQKEREEAREAGLVDENPKPEVEVIQTVTKIDPTTF